LVVIAAQNSCFCLLIITTIT